MVPATGIAPGRTNARVAGYALRNGEYVDAYTMARLNPNPARIASSGSA